MSIVYAASPELRSCVEVEVAVLGSPSLKSLMVSVDVTPSLISLTISVDFKHHIYYLLT